MASTSRQRRRWVLLLGRVVGVAPTLKVGNALVQVGDDMQSVEAQTGCKLTTSLLDRSVPFGADAYVPSFEVVEEHVAMRIAKQKIGRRVSNA